ncbi:MAG: GIY-YIG nuclease family protein [Gammaproteobacteria bacterium]|nr:GIY-YIG nuclease family protein [Gammaproteobacteria bacterium]MBU1602191.1 GIY-YIG nuclease family protein [Gammaproteobacteria bacterium]MBU2434238.1 GIY-YIG nuclease family protein [Gammaproteobacteria bacterium]MBU2448437.1 GIY-YIG nuclease family protein [Gammaproteobacteria bacterium]
MTQSVTLTIKGTGYYSAPSLLTKGLLCPGTPLSLRHEWDNPHDPNAVAIHIRATGAKLGHVSREIAPKYATLVDQALIQDAKVANASLNGGAPKIHITVVYRTACATTETASSLGSTNLPSSPGVYSIRNYKTAREYIGSSKDIKKRVSRHFQELRFGTHGNRILQEDFVANGERAFSASVVALCGAQQLAVVEELEIKKRLASNVDLYNSTTNGQGVGFRPINQPVPLSVSDKKRPMPSSWVNENQKIQGASGCLGGALFLLVGGAGCISYSVHLLLA